MDNEINPQIGKFIIEILTTSMYEDCRFIYREYIQNSADQIDKAISQGLLTKADENIFITIDSTKRRIEIEDNATGINQINFAPILLDIAQSTKVKGKDKGFRGIGRLGGLGYCDRLIFETSFDGEDVKSIMNWDAKLLKEIIGNTDIKENAIEVIKRVTTITTLPEDIEKHYFKVILVDVTNDQLLDQKSIEDYLKMVAPIPYQPGFIFKSQIKEFCNEFKITPDEYKIYLNGSLLYKAYTTSIYTENNGNRKKLEGDEVFDIQFFKEYCKNGHLLYWGWFSISNFTKQLESCNVARGIRLRKNNIQIGSEDTLVKLFREKRGNYYFFGEVHAITPDLIPNSRRDYFSENTACHLFESKLKNFFHTELHKLYYEASKIRSANKDIQSFIELRESITTQESVGFTNNEQRDKLYKDLETSQNKATDAKKKLDRILVNVTDKDTPVAKIYHRVVDTHDIMPSEIEIRPEEKKTIFVTDKYSWLSKRERKLLVMVFTVIENALSKELAKNLIDKIDEELTK